MSRPVTPEEGGAPPITARPGKFQLGEESFEGKPVLVISLLADPIEDQDLSQPVPAVVLTSWPQFVTVMRAFSQCALEVLGPPTIEDMKAAGAVRLDIAFPSTSKGEPNQ